MELKKIKLSEVLKVTTDAVVASVAAEAREVITIPLAEGIRPVGLGVTPRTYISLVVDPGDSQLITLVISGYQGEIYFAPGYAARITGYVPKKEVSVGLVPEHLRPWSTLVDSVAGEFYIHEALLSAPVIMLECGELLV